MPESITYIVTQIREVKVTANKTIDAGRLAAAAFEHGQDSSWAIAKDKGPEGIWGNTTAPIKEISIEIVRLV